MVVKGQQNLIDLLNKKPFIRDELKETYNYLFDCFVQQYGEKETKKSILEFRAVIQQNQTLRKVRTPSGMRIATSGEVVAELIKLSLHKYRTEEEVLQSKGLLMLAGLEFLIY